MRTLFALHRLAGWVLLASAVAAAPRLPAQAPATSTPVAAVRPFVGAFLPTGDHRDLLKDAVVVGASVSYDVNANVTVLGSVGWAPSKDKSLHDTTVDLFQYDVGLEASPRATSVGAGWLVKPLAGLGLGGRTYDYRDVGDADAQTVFDGYGALGIDAAYQHLGLRLEARDYVSNFKGLRGNESSSTRNDVMLFAGIGLKF